jgi:hypothetical protein
VIPGIIFGGMPPLWYHTCSTAPYVIPLTFTFSPKQMYSCSGTACGASFWNQPVMRVALKNGSTMRFPAVSAYYQSTYYGIVEYPDYISVNPWNPCPPTISGSRIDGSVQICTMREKEVTDMTNKKPSTLPPADIPAGYHFCPPCGVRERQQGLQRNTLAWFQYTCKVHGTDILSRGSQDTSRLGSIGVSSSIKRRSHDRI